MPADAALADRSEQIPQRAVAEEVEALVSDLEARVIRIADATAASLAGLLCRSKVRGRRNVPLLLELLDDLLHQPVDPLFGVLRLLPVFAEQPLEQLVGQRSVEQRFEDGVVQRLHRVPVIV